MTRKLVLLLAGIALPMGGWSLLATTQQPDTELAAIEQRIERLRSRVEGVESIRAIKRLQYAYGHYVELGLWNDFADLFTEDAVTNYQQGVRGKEAIRKLFFDQVGQGKLGLGEGRVYAHILLQPVIHLAPDGRTAKGRWRILAMLGGFGGSATWYSGIYENEYVLEDGAWKIRLLHSEPTVTAAYAAAGWTDSGTRVPFHYDAESAGTPIPETVTASPTTDDEATPSLSSLSDRVYALTERSARLEDQAQVTNLLHTYGYAVDRKQWDQVANLFAADGTMELGLQGVYVGKASIRRALNRFGPQGLSEGELNDHVHLQTIVSVAPDGRTARARGVDLIMSSAPGGQNGELSEGIFENTFIKQDGAWKIQSVHFYPRMVVDAREGWAKSAKPAAGPSREFPPDRGPTSSYEIYPKFAVAPFHFDNPVTGRPPQYPDGVVSAKIAKADTAATRAPEVRNRAQLEARLAEAERSIGAAEAYDAGENLVGAYGYSVDDFTDSAIHVAQVLQPVIEVAPDGETAQIRARLLEMGGAPGAAGSWSAGVYEARTVRQDGAWKLQTIDLEPTWSAPYPGGWARTPAQ